MDKYEKFKKWFKKNKYGIWKVSDFKIDLTNETVININEVFEIFEEEQAEKEKGKEIKDTIEQALHEEHCCFDGTRLYANTIYNRLKEKDLIK